MGCNRTTEGLTRKRKRGGRHRRRSQGVSAGGAPIRNEFSGAFGNGDEELEEGDAGSKKSAGVGAVERRGSSGFLQRMKARLAGGHFRMINEKLYSCTGKEAFDYFNEDPALFDAYHAGYEEQMSRWPEKPVNLVIEWLRSRDPSWVVADFGCGNARLARNVENRVLSFDLVSNHPSVTACDMSNVPVGSSAVDVAVFCLSLMGTEFSRYLEEAERILRPGGWLLAAEVRSRFDPNSGGADLGVFIDAVCALGFVSVKKDLSNRMFVMLYFVKNRTTRTLKKRNIRWPALKPCMYKRR